MSEQENQTPQDVPEFGVAEGRQELQPGAIIHNYKVIRELGRGAMAIVYLAEQLDLARPVALKILSGELAKDADYVSRFFNEARSAAVLSHPNIIQAYDAGKTHDGLYYFCMEYVEGESMLDIIDREGRVPLEQALELSAEVAEALDYGFQHYKFTHGDIKPENIMVNTKGQAKLADFGLAKVEGHEYDGSDVMLTPLYAPPELIKGIRNKADCRGDIYAFGATLYHAVAGTPPFPGTNAQEVLDRHLNENPEPLKLRFPQAPAALSDLVDKMLVKNPDARLSSWSEVLAGLEKVRKGMAEPDKKHLSLKGTGQGTSHLKKAPVPGVKPPRTASSGNSNTLLIFIIVMILCVVVMAVLCLLKKPSAAPAKPKAPQEQAAQAKAPQAAVPGKAAPSSKDSFNRVVQRTITLGDAGGAEEDLTSGKPAASLLDASEEESAEEKAEGEDAEEKRADRQEGEPEAGGEPTAKKSQVQKAPPRDAAAELAIPLKLSDELKGKQDWCEAADMLNTVRLDMEAGTVDKASEEALAQWLEAHQGESDARQFIAFVKDTVFPEISRGKKVVIASHKLYAGTSFSTHVFGRRKATYRVRTIDEKGVRQEISVGNSNMAKNLTWEQARKENVMAQLCLSLLKHPAVAEADKKPLVAWLVFLGHAKVVQNGIQQYVTDDSLRQWTMLVRITDFLSPDLKKGVGLLKQLVWDCEQGSRARAAELAQKLLESKDFRLSDEDSAALEALVEQCSAACPSIHAGSLARKARELEDGDGAEEGYRLALVASNRYAAAKFPEKSSLEKVMGDCFAGIPDDGRVDRKVGNRPLLPLLAVKDPIVPALASRNSDAYFTSEPHQKDYKRCLRLAQFAMGDWRQGQALFEGGSDPMELGRFSRDIASFAKLAYNYGKFLYQRQLSDDKPGIQWLSNARMEIPTFAQDAIAMAVASRVLLDMRSYPESEDIYKNLRWTPGNTLAGEAQSKRQVYYQAFILWKEAEAAVYLDKLAKCFKEVEGAHTAGFWIPKQTALFKAMLAGEDVKPLDEATMDGKCDWPLLWAWCVAAAKGQGINGDGDEFLREYIQSNGASWPVFGGDAILWWLLYRSSQCLAEDDLMTAIDLVRWAISLELPCLLSRELELQMLEAGLMALAGKHGGVATAIVNLRVSELLTDQEKKFLKDFAGMQGNVSRKKVGDILRKLPDGRPIVFWIKWLSEIIGYDHGHKVEMEGLEGKYAMRLPEAALFKAMAAYAERHPREGAED